MFRTSRLIRYINQNRRKIILVIGIIAGIIIVIQLLNAFAESKLEKNAKVNNNVVKENTYQPNKTILTNTTIEEAQAEKNTEVIEEFVQYCNNGEIQKAYDLLTDECKEVLYPTVDKFENNYHKKIFNGKKIYNIQSWMSTSDCYTYKIKYLDNVLSSGKYGSSDAIEDYITIIEKENEVKLNINYYIKRQEINKKQEKGGIILNVIQKDIYMEYEQYVIKVTNNINEDILLDSLETVDGIKLLGKNNVEYQAFTNELSSYDMKVPSENTKNITLKFSKEYNPQREVESIIFSNIILNAKEYKGKNSTEVNVLGIEVKL